jgi:group I intron endonuclease
MMLKTGIYKIENKVNGKIYIGSTSHCFATRFRRHKSDLNANKHHSGILQRAWNKYGEDNFTFEIIAHCHPDECIRFEQLYIDSYSPEYNVCPKAGSVKGIKRTEAYAEAISERMQGNTIWRGRTHTEEAKQKIAIANKGKKPHTTGTHRSEETKLRIAQALKGRKVSDEVKAKISLAHKGRPSWNTGTKGIMQAWNKGCEWSESTKAKMALQKIKYAYVVVRQQDAEKFELNNLRQFCIENNLQEGNLNKTLNCDSYCHKGFKMISKTKIA